MQKSLGQFFLAGQKMANFFVGPEWCGPSRRALFTILSHCCYALGLMLLSGMAYGIHNWRILQLVVSAPIVILSIYFW